MRPDATVVSDGGPGSTSERLSELLAHWGVRVRRSPLSDALACGRPRGAPALLALDARAAARSLADAPDAAAAVAFAAESLLGDVLLFDTPPSEAMDGLLRVLSRGAVTGIRELDGSTRTYEVGIGRPQMTGSLTGLRLGPVASSREFAIECAEDDAGVETVIRANGRPLFVEVRREGAGRLYLLATAGGVLDLDEATERLDDTASFSAYIPIVMLLRGLFGDAVWHASASFAGVVVDDPLLTPRYGYLDYERLLADMDGRGYSTEVAFIPLNRRRTRPRTARLFTERADRLSICVHGCDHTRAEFGTSDQARLRKTVATARQRMEEHRLRTGLGYDDVMVFPQGIFSVEAMRALQDGRFSAAVNSGPTAVDDGRGPTNRDFLDVAVRRYGGIPLFVRRTTADPGFAADAFLGRPALVVCHPSDFRDGHAEIGRVVDDLNSAGVRWATLGEIARELNVQRRVSRDRIHVRAVSHRTVLRNESSLTQTYLVVKSEPGRTVSAVRSSRESLPFRRRGDSVFFAVEVPPGAEETVELSFAEAPALERLRHGAREYARIVAGRRLSEVRDVWLIRSDSLLGLARRFAGRA